MPRKDEGLFPLGNRATEAERQMIRDTAAHLGISQNRAVRWAIRYAWAHATSTTDHTTCGSNSTCAGAVTGTTPGNRQRAAPHADQLTITHEATVEDT